MSAISLEERVTALEKEVLKLKRVVNDTGPNVGWKKLVGAFLNDPYFEQAMNYGRKFRESQRASRKSRNKPSHGNS